MKCPNCGGEVSVNETHCPYCGTQNPEGISFHSEIHRRKTFNEFLRNEIEKQMQLPLLQRILNLCILIMALLFLLLFFLNMGWFLIKDGELIRPWPPKDLDARLETLYEEGRFGELYALMDTYHLKGEDYPLYMQIGLIYSDYEALMYHSLSCTSALRQGELPDPFHLRYGISSSLSLLCPDIPAYPELYPENAEALKPLQEEAHTLLTGLFLLTEEEIETITSMIREEEFSRYDQEERLLWISEARLKEVLHAETEE